MGNGRIAWALPNMPRPIHNPEHWHARAAEARALAEKITDATAKKMMLGTAEAYDALAHDAEWRKMAAGRKTDPVRAIRAARWRS
jgi:hypothetical protein